MNKISDERSAVDSAFEYFHTLSLKSERTQMKLNLKDFVQHYQVLKKAQLDTNLGAAAAAYVAQLMPLYGAGLSHQ